MTESIPKQTSRSVLRNVAYGALTWILPIGLNFVAMPVIVHSLGSHDYGLYALVGGIISYSFAFAVSRAITKYIAEYRTSGRSDKIRDIVSATFFLNIIVGTVGLLVIFALSGWLVRDVFRIDAQDQQKTIVALWLGSGVIFVTMFGQVFSAVLQGIQRFDVYSKIFTTGNVALVSGNLVLAWYGYGLLALFWWNLGVAFIVCVMFIAAARRLLPEVDITFSFGREAMRLVGRYSASIIIYQILSNVLLVFERGWITHELGSEDLTYYVVPMSLGILMHGFIASLLLVIFPLASELNSDREKLLKLYTKATKAVFVTVVFIVATASIQSEHFLDLWMGPQFVERSSSLLIIHMVCFGMVAVLAISFQMTEGLGYPQFNAAITGVTTFVAIALMLALTQRFGNTGVAIGRLTGFGVAFLSIFVVERWFFRKVQGRFWLSLAANVAVAAAPAVLLQYGINSLLAESWLVLLLSVGCGGIAYVLILWLLNFVTADEKLLIRAALSR